jgi:hypothetical protein
MSGNEHVRINKRGFLSIQRAGEWREQCCPFAANEGREPAHCGDWCPLFAEPIGQADDLPGSERGPWRPRYLSLGCGSGRTWGAASGDLIEDQRWEREEGR